LRWTILLVAPAASAGHPRTAPRQTPRTLQRRRWQRVRKR
jgi:hypothetical protein